MKSKCLFSVIILLEIVVFPTLSQARIDLTSIMTSDEFSNCDYNAFESKLVALEYGNEFLKTRFGLMQYQLDKQQKMWQDIDEKLQNIELNLQTIENRMSKESKEHLSGVKDAINQQYQTIMSRLPPAVGDGKSELLIEMKETLKSHSLLFEAFKKNFKNLESSLKKTNAEQNTQILKDSISKNFIVLEKIDQKLTNIESGSATKRVPMEINQNLLKYINRNESCFTCLGGELVCTNDPYPTNCAEFDGKFCSDNMCRIHNDKIASKSFLVSCDNKLEGGGWTVIQRRMDGSVDFYRDWSEYKTGFGDINGEFFIGLDKLNALTTTLKPVELLIQLREFNDTMQYIKYDEFEIGNETEKYRLIKVGKYSGSIDCLTYQLGSNFTTKDRDNGPYGKNCANILKSGWWHKDCSLSNLNGKYYKTNETANAIDGLTWCSRSPHGYKYSIKYTQMSIRPKRT